MPSKKKGEARSHPQAKLNDPYLTTKGYPEPTICPVCGLVYYNKHWVKDNHLLSVVKSIGYKHKCPSCRKIEDHFAMGIIFISQENDFVEKHKSEIINLIRNEARREFLRNPLDRIMSLKDNDGEITVETTSENLAMAIGKALERAYKGKLEFSFSRENKQVKVYWKR